jgi:hypothetical protein
MFVYIVEMNLTEIIALTTAKWQIIKKIVVITKNYKIMETKTLIERLSKENFDKLMNCQYRALADMLINTLEKNRHWSELTIEEAMILNNNILDLGYFDMNKFIKLFENEN